MMDSTRKIPLLIVGDGEAEKLQDNRHLSLDAGRREGFDDNGPKLLIMELYPWIQQFKKMCRSTLFQPSMTSLKHLMMYYTRNVRLSVNECYTKPLRAEKLKEFISESLLFFLYYYREIGEDHDRASYMDLMTDLLAMYIDMELKASKRGREHNSKVAARLSSCLHVYLEHSAEHMLDALLKVHFMTHNYNEILDPVITKIFKGIQEHPNSSIMYVRYFLAYRLWKKLNKDIAVRNQINVSALASLGTVPTDFPPFIIESVLPKVPKSQKLSTKSLLLYKFDVDKCCEEFFKFCKRERGLNASKGEQRTCPANTQPSSMPEDNDACVLNVHSNVLNVCSESQLKCSSSNSLINETDTNSKTVSLSQATSSLKLTSLRKTKKSNGIIFIDLTSDNVTEKVIRQKKTRRKLFWLEEAKKRINDAKMMPKKIDSAAEDVALAVQQLENTMNLDSLRVESPRCRESSETEIIIADETCAEERTTMEDASQAGTEIAERLTTVQEEFPMTSTTHNSEEHCNINDCNQLMALVNIKSSVDEKITEEGRTELLEVASSISNISTIEAETAGSVAVNFNRTDEFFNAKKMNDKRESLSCNTVGARDNESRMSESIKLDNNKAIETRPELIQQAIKAEHVIDEAYGIINEEIVSNSVELPIAEEVSRPSLEFRCSEEIEQVVDCSTKIRAPEFQDNIDGLSLLASVSQRVSLLTTSPQLTGSRPVNGELIKVKNYASLANSTAADEPVTSSGILLTGFCNGNSIEPEVINRVIGIYPEDAMDKVAYQVEVTSTGEIDSYDHECDEAVNGVITFQINGEESCRNNQPQGTNVASVDTITQADKDDTNVILNGETVVLFQKSPNSNLYIINKAVENRDHGNDDVSGGIRDIAEHANETGAFSYDSVYRNQSSIPYDLMQYNRDVSTQEGRRNKKVIARGDATGETNKPSDTIKLAKPGKNIALPLDIIGKGTTGKRKISSNSALSRRRRIKQEYNGCGNDLPSHITPNYGIQECSQEHAESTRSSIHVPVTHSSPLSSIYTSYTGGAELYLPCHKKYNSMTCGLPVNSKGSAGGNGHCSCLNCTYGIVAHCGECILPSNENRPSAIDNSSYYLPIHSTVQPAVAQDCSGQDPLVKIFDDQLVCKLEQTILDSEPLENVGVKCEPKEIYRAKLDNKLPLKKRFKAMMSVSFEEMSIKREKAQSYPGTPMLSIAALDSQDVLHTGCTERSVNSNNSMDLLLEERGETHHASEMIRRDYRKDMMMMLPPSSGPNGYGYCNRNNGSSSSGNSSSSSSSERKRKRRTTPQSCNVDKMRLESYQKISKTSVKHKETITTIDIASKRLTAPNKSQSRPLEKVKESDAAPIKNSTRQTRSSKRNVPKVNYIYADGDSDWNPSGGGSKRKRKKTSR